MSLNEILVSGNANANPLNVLFGSMRSNSNITFDTSILATQYSNMTASSGGTYTVTAASLPNAIFYYAGAGALTFALPSVASINAYLSTLGFSSSPNLVNQSFPVKIVNAGAGAITVTNGGDTNWTIQQHTSTAVIPATISANACVILQVPTGAANATFIW